MEENIFVINPGSASRKYALYQGKERQVFFHFEKERDGFVVTATIRDKTIKVSVEQSDYDGALSYVRTELRESGLSFDSVDTIGVRIVAPGTYFQTNRVIDEVYETRLREVVAWAPLHIEPILMELSAVRELLPEVRLIGVSDSAFHASLPDVARYYALPHADTEKFDIMRFGYHGISVQSVVRRYEQEHGSLPAKTVVCHLGGGSSVTALKNGVSVDTSMGFTPLEGVPMATRSGDIDAGVLFCLAQRASMSIEELNEYITTKSGLLGISNISGDVRELLDSEAKHDKRAKLALDIYAYKIRKYIGSYMAVLGSLDLLILTATISERSAIMRRRIISGFDDLGVVLDEELNDQLDPAGGFIESEKSGSRIVVVPTDEMGEIAYQLSQINE